MNTKSMMEEAYEAWLRAGAVLNRLNPGAEIDEMAFVFATPKELDRFVLDAKAENFNSVKSDQMVRQDRQQSFEVRFEFLQGSKVPFRIEAMCVLSGDAPLHARHLHVHGSGSLVHASWKCGWQEMYDAEKERMRPCSFFQAEYRNSYGMFSYWKMREDVRSRGALGPLFLKPRVNLRDSSSG